MLKAQPLDDTVNKMREALHRQILDAVSHDLKTPLAAIIGSLEIYFQMQEKLSAEKSKTLVTTALTEAYRLDNFITNILDMAKLEGALVKVRAEPCDFTRLLNDCLSRLGPRRLQCNISTKLIGNEKYIHIDSTLLCRAINLVLENAMKHAGKNPVIFIEYGVENELGFVHVRDCGPGILQGKEKEIFSKYTRFHNADHQNAGTGLGLAICRQLMGLLSGNIEVKNHPEGGAVFTLKFPTKME
jgi:two-component system sensor histidine kinase KdpD